MVSLKFVFTILISSLLSTTATSNTSLSQKFLNDLYVNRSGATPFSMMLTQDLELLAHPKGIYQFRSKHGLRTVPYCENAKKIRKFQSTDTLPIDLKFAEFSGKWSNKIVQVDDSNILGGNSSLVIRTSENQLVIPVVKATEKTLSYYKAHLLKDGDFFQFKIRKDFPIFNMNIGKNYVQDYLLKTNKGMYLEYHNEPHYHEPRNQYARGVYVLAKMVGDSQAHEDEQLFHITGFYIPYGTAVYTEPGSIHDDATTEGLWRVGYTLASQYSTATILNSEGSLVEFGFTGNHPF